MKDKMNKVEIKIPKADEDEVATFPSGEIGNIKKKFERFDQILYGIMLVVVLSMVAIIISVIGLFLDQIHFNNAIYREHSDKVQSIDITKEIDRKLYQQNKENQKIILDQQKQIQQLMGESK